MKMKLFGLTVFELERDALPMPARTGLFPPTTTTDAAVLAARKSDSLRTNMDLNESKDILPRKESGTIDIEASLRLFGIADPKILWDQRFKPGTAGAALKCVLGAQGRKPKPSGSGDAPPNLNDYPADGLPVVPSTGKLDIPGCLALFDIRDPADLWKKRFPPTSAGGRIKMCLRASGFPDLPRTNSRLEISQESASTPSSATGVSPVEPSDQKIQNSCIKQDPRGRIDIEASLQALGISDPKSLWRNPVEPGSAEHVLKKEIARALGKRLVVAGITRTDIGLTA